MFQLLGELPGHPLPRPRLTLDHEDTLSPSNVRRGEGLERRNLYLY